MNHVEDLLWDWLHGALSDDESVQVETHLENCADCRANLDQQTEMLAMVAVETETTTVPTRESILALATSQNRFARFVNEIARLTDVAIDQALDWSKKLGDPEAYIPSAVEVMSIFHIEGGPTVEDAIVGFVKIKAGEEFPEHTHLGVEYMLILQGKLRDGDTVYGPGELVENAGGTTHTIAAEPGVDLIYLNVTQVGIEVYGMKFGPESPDM